MFFNGYDFSLSNSRTTISFGLRVTVYLKALAAANECDEAYHSRSDRQEGEVAAVAMIEWVKPLIDSNDQKSQAAQN